MGIHLREHIDTRGDVVEHSWYCSHTCYADSLRVFPPCSAFEQGGAYPCGSEADMPDYCATCGAPIGNPVTEEGAAYIVAYVLRVLAPEPDETEGHTEEDRARAHALYREYRYAFANVELPDTVH